MTSKKLTTKEKLVAIYDIIYGNIDWKLFLIREGFWSVSMAFRRYQWLMTTDSKDRLMIAKHKRLFYRYLNDFIE